MVVQMAGQQVISGTPHNHLGGQVACVHASHDTCMMPLHVQ